MDIPKLAQKRPRWSLKASFLTALGILCVTTLLVLLAVKKSIWAELEIVTVAISCMMFAYLTTVLHLGVRFDKNERFVIDWPKGRPFDLMDVSVQGAPDTGGLFTELGAESGIAGLLLGLLVDIVASLVLIIVIPVILWLGMNAILAVPIVVGLPLFYFYRRALRGIVLRGRRCRGSIGLSLFHAFTSTIGYTFWFYGIFFLAHRVDQFFKIGERSL